MIQWLRGKFSSIVGFCFVLTVIAAVVSGGIAGYEISYEEVNGCFIGIILGLLLGIILGILSFGLIATIINISETNEKILARLDQIQSIVYNGMNKSDSDSSNSAK